MPRPAVMERPGAETRVLTTSDPDEFAANVGDWLALKPVDNNVLLALGASGVPPGQGDPVFAWVTGARGSVLGAAFARLPYRMPVSAMPGEAAHALAEHLYTVLPGLAGVAGPVETAGAFAARWSQLSGKAARRERDQGLMVCTETARPANPPGRSRLATEDDLDMAAEWFSHSMQGSGMPAEQIAQRSRQLAGGQIAGRRLIIWESQDGTPVGAAGWGAPVAGVARLAGAFVSPDHRGSGIATLLWTEATARALEEGAQACVCTIFEQNESMLAVTEKAGYRRLADLTEYSFE